MEFKCQLAINFDSKKLSAFTVRDGYTTNVNSNFFCCVRKKTRRFTACLQNIFCELLIEYVTLFLDQAIPYSDFG